MTIDVNAMRVELEGLFPHPFDWMHGLVKPPFWHRRQRKGHEQIAYAADLDSKGE